MSRFTFIFLVLNLLGNAAGAVDFGCEIKGTSAFADQSEPHKETACTCIVQACHCSCHVPVFFNAEILGFDMLIMAALDRPLLQKKDSLPEPRENSLFRPPIA